jgi:vanillate O-demethylase monooxygenase subunit
MSWHEACAADVLGTDAPLAAVAEGRNVVLWRTEGGRPVAFADLCAHMPLPLSTGRCEGGRLQCRYHGLTYDPSGAVVGVYSHAIEDERRVRTYPAAERGGHVWVWLGDPEEADEDLIPSS